MIRPFLASQGCPKFQRKRVPNTQKEDFQKTKKTPPCIIQSKLAQKGLLFNPIHTRLFGAPCNSIDRFYGSNLKFGVEIMLNRQWLPDDSIAKSKK